MISYFLPGYGVVALADTQDQGYLPGYGVVAQTVVTPAPADSTGWKPLGGDVSAWLEPLPPEVEEIIAEVAEAEAQKEAVKDEPRKAPIKPLRIALARNDFQFKTDYAEVYRRAYMVALDRIREEIRQDDEEALFVLM